MAAGKASNFFFSGQPQHAERTSDAQAKSSRNRGCLTFIEEEPIGLEILGESDGFNFNGTKGKAGVNGRRSDNLEPLGWECSPFGHDFRCSRLKHFREYGRWRNDAAEERRQNIRLSNEDQVIQW